jgi:putative transposase
MGLVLAVVVTAANVSDPAAVADLLFKSQEAGWNIQRAKVDGIYKGSKIEEASKAFNVDFEMTIKPANQVGKPFIPLPLRWKVEATNGTNTNRYRRLTRNWEASPKAAEDAVLIASVRRVLKIYNRTFYETK